MSFEFSLGTWEGKDGNEGTMIETNKNTQIGREQQKIVGRERGRGIDIRNEKMLSNLTVHNSGIPSLRLPTLDLKPSLWLLKLSYTAEYLISYQYFLLTLF